MYYIGYYMLTVNTHDYDGRLPLLTRRSSISLDDCISSIRSLTIDPLVHQALNLLQDPANNYDPVNKMNACDVLCLAWECVRTHDTVDYVLEQLADIIRSGSCLQGRTTRLYQLIFLPVN